MQVPQPPQDVLTTQIDRIVGADPLELVGQNKKHPMSQNATKTMTVVLEGKNLAKTITIN